MVNTLSLVQKMYEQVMALNLNDCMEFIFGVVAEYTNQLLYPCTIIPHHNGGLKRNPFEHCILY